MTKIEKNMYVRTRSFKGFPSKIDKIREIEYNQGPKNETYIALEKDEEKCRRWTEDYIVGEPSFNIIDLIEVGDYIDGQRIYYDEELDYLYVRCIDGDDNLYCESINKQSFINNIKSIATKEQFEAIQYEVS